MPDATGLELLAGDLRDLRSDGVLDTVHHRGQATIVVEPAFIRDALEHVVGKGYTFLASLHGVDYFPEEPRLGVHYEMLDMRAVDRVRLKLRVSTEEPRVASVVDMFPTADHQEREVYDMFGVVFDGHPDMRRILMPEDYEGYPQRRDFPIGGEPVLFTHNEPRMPAWWK
ncbi:MAG: NADH-ubiquinone oxidoreductase chain C [uncultured Solirubrobacteraceae bacterium]|uniref:NADH-quinone oxidoreductase subunit C n=1 Tax=uncultured Solirubrobacteraceae bacterium TaxID=1162706 RepID=A0A6J4S0V2_9ACTN|nr:MAG: NADH-ubiquinone oxidoreductase chain C [uncultured Solirubrobacteraceae bacterium]